MNFILISLSIVLMFITIATSFLARRIWIPIFFSFLSGLALVFGGSGVSSVSEGLKFGMVMGIILAISIVPGGRVTRKARLKAVDKDNK